MVNSPTGIPTSDTIAGPFYVGLDVGSSFVHYVVLGRDARILYSPSAIMHFANPLGALREAWQDITRHFDASRVVSTAFTGSGARALPLVMGDMIYLYDSVAIPKGAALLDPKARFVFHIGAKDPYFFELTRIHQKQIIQEWRTGSKCGGGSGTLIEKQCRRLLNAEIPSPTMEDPGEAGEADREPTRVRNRVRLQDRMTEMFRRAQAEAAKAEEPSEFLARCGVVIQSDLIHKQNEGASRADNLAGLFRTVAGNYKIDVLGSRTFSSQESEIPALATGGVMANDLIKDHLAELLGIPIRRPEHFSEIAALGVAVKAIEEDNHFVFDMARLEEAAERIRGTRPFAPALSTALKAVHNQSQPLDEDVPAGTEVVIGIDGGSTTTKGAARRDQDRQTARQALHQDPWRPRRLPQAGDRLFVSAQRQGRRPRRGRHGLCAEAV